MVMKQEGHKGFFETGAGVCGGEAATRVNKKAWCTESEIAAMSDSMLLLSLAHDGEFGSCRRGRIFGVPSGGKVLFCSCYSVW